MRTLIHADPAAVRMRALLGRIGSAPAGSASDLEDGSRFAPSAARAAWLSIALTLAALILLVALHFLSPEFAPSWRMISEYALGRHAWVLALMFLTMGSGSWALAAAMRREVATRGGRIGLCLLIAAGLGGNLASVFDITHPLGHMIAGLLGVVGFPVAALLISVSLGGNEAWRNRRRPLLWWANLSWASVVVLVLTLALMTIEVSKAYGGHLPDHAPPALPPGVLPLDGWADRLIVVTNSIWLLLAAVGVIEIRRENHHPATTI